MNRPGVICIRERSHNLLNRLSELLSRNSRLGHNMSFRSNHGFSIIGLMVRRTAIVARSMLFNNRFLPSEQAKLGALKKLRAKYLESDALIVAGGPSASDIDPQEVSALQKTGRLVVFALNNYVHSRLSGVLTPDFVVFSDPLHHPNKDSLNTLIRTADKFPKAYMMIPRDWWPMDGFAAQIWSRTLCFEDRSLESFGTSLDPTRLRRYVSLTTLKAMAVAHYLGFRRIGLIGFDATTYRGLRVDSDNYLRMSSHHHAGQEYADRKISRNAKGEQSNGTFSGASDYFHAEATLHLYLDKLFAPTGKFVNLSTESVITSFGRATPGQFFSSETH